MAAGHPGDASTEESLCSGNQGRRRRTDGSCAALRGGMNGLRHHAVHGRQARHALQSTQRARRVHGGLRDMLPMLCEHAREVVAQQQRLLSRQLRGHFRPQPGQRLLWNLGACCRTSSRHTSQREFSQQPGTALKAPETTWLMVLLGISRFIWMLSSVSSACRALLRSL